MTIATIPTNGSPDSLLKKLWNFSKFSKRKGLSISNENETGRNYLALDVKNRKLFFASLAPGTDSCTIVDLNNIEKFSIKKEYNSIKAGELVTRKLHHFLKRIMIQLVLKNRVGTISLPVFEAWQEQNKNLEQLELKVKRWETMVKKLLPVSKREIV